MARAILAPAAPTGMVLAGAANRWIQAHDRHVASCRAYIVAEALQPRLTRLRKRQRAGGTIVDELLEPLSTACPNRCRMNSD